MNKRRIYLMRGDNVKLAEMFGKSRTTIDNALDWVVGDTTSDDTINLYLKIRECAKKEFNGKYLIKYEGADIYILCEISDQFKDDYFALNAILKKEKENTLRNKGVDVTYF